MKKHTNIIKMSRLTFCLNLLSTATILFFLLFPTSVVRSENKKVQEILLKGYVRDAHTKKPINAAQISIPNKNLSAVSDDKGFFTLKVSSLKDVLHVSAYDYNLNEVPLNGKDSVVIELYSNLYSNYFVPLEGVTGTINNSALTSSVKGTDNLSKSNAISVDELVQSEFGGDVRAISRSGVPGMGASLFIQGINSLNANAQPLFVVDGVIWDNLYDIESVHKGFFSNPLDNIDVNDIENITVVKDGSSIYGSKASNGVILIKTKRSKSIVTKIGLNYFTGVTTQPGSYPMMNGEEFRNYASDMINSKSDLNVDVSKYPFLGIDPSLKTLYNMNHNNTSWANQVYQAGRTSSYTINATGGDEKAMYYFSLGYADDNGVVKGTDMSRINSRFNADMIFTNYLSMSLNIGFTRIERDLLDDGVYNTSPTWVSKVKSPFLSPFEYTTEGQVTTVPAKTDSFGISSPLGIIKNSVNNLKNYRFNIGILPTIYIAKGLVLSSQFDYSLDKTIENRFVPMYYTPKIYIPNDGFSFDEVNSQVMRNTDIFDDSRLTWDKKFGVNNHLKTILGWRFINNYYESDYAEEHNTGSNTNVTITNPGDVSYLTLSGINKQTNSISNYVNVDYDFDNRYYITGTVAMDASSRFGKETGGGFQMLGRSWAVFPSIGGAWLVSSEKFMKNVDFINFLKIRTAYSVTGNDGIKDYTSIAYFNSIDFMDKASGLVISNLENNKIQWETTNKWSAGADLCLFKNRLSLSFDYFSGNTSNLLVIKNQPYVTGLVNYWSNGGTMTNKGYDVSANLKAINFKNLKWELGLSVGHYTNLITSLPVTASSDGSYTTSVYGGEVLTAVGYAAGSFYGYQTKGVFATDAQASSAYTDKNTGVKDYLRILNPDGTYSKIGAGNVIFVDRNGDGIIDSKDKTVIGNPNPNFYGTFNSKISYKRFTLSTLFTYSFGNDIYNYQRSQLEAGDDFSNQTSAMSRRWTADGQVTNQPQATYGDPLGNARFSDRWIEDGSYIRIKNVTFSYDLPIKSNYIDGISIWISANNLYTFTQYLGLDPEVSSNNSVYFQGIDNGLIPLTRSYFLGIKLNL
jgi:TonB-linked SusC/RagA family outer membrane protein